MAATPEDVTFGDFSALCLEEYQALFQDLHQSCDVEFPWDDRSVSRSTVPSAAGSGNCTLGQQAFVKQPTPQSSPVVSNNVRGSEGHQSPHYGLSNASSSGGVMTREYTQVNSQQWTNQSASQTDIESLDQNSALIDGNDEQLDESSKKRRNKKRRDPEYYKSYYNRVQGSVDNDSGTENWNMREDYNYSGTVEYVPQTVPAEQHENQSEANTAPTPSYEYNADEKSTERTSYCMESNYQSTTYEPKRTSDISDDKQIRFDSKEESMPLSDNVNVVAVDTVGVKDAPAKPEYGSEDVKSSVPSVPIIHISPSESTTPNVQIGDSFDESFPVATAEGSGGQPAATSATAPAVKSWASLFKGSSGSRPGQMANTPYVAISVSSDPMPGESADDGSVSLVTTDKDPHAKRLGEHLSKVMPSHHPMNLQPRGLINTANWCYINSILQALLSCPPFYHIMKNMPLNNGIRKSSSTPMLDAMYQFLKEFQELKGLSKRTPLDIRPGPCFEPTVIYQMLSVAQTSLSVKHGRQEDAEEFLSCLLNGLHDEMTSLIQLYNGVDIQAADTKQNGPASSSSSVGVANGDVGNGHQEEGSDEDEWEQVGPRNKSSITRRAQFSSSPLSKIFGGIMRSALHQHGSKESATLQPFFSLQLDIQSQDIWSVQTALDTLGNRESVHGFMSNKTKKEVEAFRRITLEELPPVLILHLKRFLYDKSGGCQKLMKKIDYTMEIEINKELISPNTKSRIATIQRTYKLFAVVYHTGKEASGGHYITDVYHVGSSGWLRCDDSIVKPVKPQQVTKPLTTCIPYLLFYRRKDLLTKPSAS